MSLSLLTLFTVDCQLLQCSVYFVAYFQDAALPKAQCHLLSSNESYIHSHSRPVVGRHPLGFHSGAALMRRLAVSHVGCAGRQAVLFMLQFMLVVRHAELPCNHVSSGTVGFLVITYGY